MIIKKNNKTVILLLVSFLNWIDHLNYLRRCLNVNMVHLQVAIKVETEIGRKTAQRALDPLISRVALQVILQIKRVFVFVVALATFVPALLIRRAYHFI